MRTWQVTVPYHRENRLAGELPGRETILPLPGDRDKTGGAMTETTERRADTTRHRLIAAASRQFARHAYSMVSLDDILTEAELTKGAMYFHFPSKQALALAIIDDLTEMSRAAVTELLARRMSGLETVIDLFYLLAVQDTQHEVAQAGARLLETLDNTTALPTTLWQSWIEFVTTLIQNAVADGDVVDHADPEDTAKMLVALWVGMRRISDLDQPEGYLDNLQRAWILVLPSFANRDRIDYFVQFIKRRQALAVKKVSAQALSL
ncbi:ScbR family autoregulator-binding transcription factor [Mycobacterium sp.]|uniref:ScbR family autoregulator-binding transcription factor n=1 Tax=Mycobacterium sp. TaxID=1785 RepID=UPI003D6A6938